jgi:hypothetical protein
MNTVLSEIKKWNIEYLRKSENDSNALAVNLLDSSETSLTLPDLSKIPIQELKLYLSEQKEKRIYELRHWA